MLIKRGNLTSKEERKLMDIYQEGNLENIEYFFPDCTDQEIGLKKVEENFCEFLKTDFFQNKENTCYILEKDKRWVSALRLNRIRDFYWIEALETHPDYRKQGLATELVIALIQDLKKEGPFIIRDSVSKQNEASLQTHKKCGFIIENEDAIDYYTNEVEQHSYGLIYRFDGLENVKKTRR